MDQAYRTTAFANWEDIDEVIGSEGSFCCLQYVKLEIVLENPVGFGLASRFITDFDLVSPRLRKRQLLQVAVFDAN